MQDDNYYKVGGSLEYQHPTYVVRQADYELYNGLTNGEFCYVLNSRQMGKSSLRVQMMKKLKEQGFKCASIDMTRIGSHVTPAEWYAGVVSELLRGFGLSRKVNFSSWWRDREALPPLQRLRELIEDVLLAEFSSKLIIFIDEIDSILKIKFKEDFFAFIRACYNQRVETPEYNRLTFCLLGVATPSDLIEDKNISTPFNIGRAIELTGFQLHEVQALIQGLEGRVSRPEVVMREVLEWTGGQPFLTQKLCKLIAQESGEFLANPKAFMPEGGEAEWVEELVRSRILCNWETQDEPEHLRTIRDRIFWSQRKVKLLQLYRQIVQPVVALPYQGGVKAKDTPEHMELRLSGLVVKQQGKLRIYNRIYASVFNQSWVENALAEAGLLPEVAKKSTPSPAEIQALEQAAFDALQQFETQELDALFLAIQAGQALKALLDSHSLQDYPTVSPLLALQTILDNIYERNKFKPHSGGVNGASFSASGRRIITVGADGRVRIWSLSGQQIVEWESNRGSIWSMSLSPNRQLIATAGLDGTVGLWELPGLELAHWSTHQGTVRCVSFSPDGQIIATVGKDEVRLWNLSGQQLAQWNANHNKVVDVSFISPDGQRLATAGEDGTLRLWNLSGEQIDQWTVHQDGVMSVSFNPNGKQIATAGTDGTIKLWDLSRQQLAEFSHHQFSVRKVSFSPDGQSFATAGWKGITLLWNLLGQQLAQLKGHQGSVRSVSFSPDGQRVVTAGSDGTTRLWDLSDKHLAQLSGHRGKVWSVSFSPDGQIIATAGRDGTARLWNLTGQQLAQLDGHQGQVWSASFSPDGQYIVTIGSDKTARLWDLSGQQLARLRGHQGWVTRVIFSPDGQRLATVGRDGTARLWDLSGQLISKVTPHQGWVWSVSFSGDGQLLAAVGLDATPPLLDPSGRLIVQLKGYQDAIASMSFSPDGQYLATVSSEDGTARLWNLFGQQLAQFDGNQGWVICVSFSLDGQIIATAGEDGSVCLWDLSGRQVARFVTKQGAIYGISFSPDGKCLATAGQDGTVKLWRVEGLDELLKRGCDWLQDYLVTHPEALEKLEIYQSRPCLIAVGRNLAIAGNVDKAIALFQRALELEPDGDSDKDLVTDNEVENDQQPCQISLEIDPRLAFDPDLNSGFDPEVVARWLAATAKVANGIELVKHDEVQEAIAAYAEAKTLAPNLEISANCWNALCWYGSLHGYGVNVMYACEKAVTLDSENGQIRDSRGLARALTGNILGAIEDFQAFIEWSDDENQKLKRQRWLDALRAGENPFTKEEIENLINEHNIVHSPELEEIEVGQDPISFVAEDSNLTEVVEVEGEAIVSPFPDRLNCESGIDYTRLRNLLAAGQWLEADLETTAIMLRVSGREEEGWLREEDLENFPCTDLLIIDNLWIEYSQGRFGFSVQKEIWESVGGKKNADYEIYCLFCKRLGWSDRLGWREFSWLQSCDLNFNTNAPTGHLPGGLLDWLWFSYRKSLLSSLDKNADDTAFRGWWNIISSMASRLAECKMQSLAPTMEARQRVVTTVSDDLGEGFLGEFLVHDKLVRIYQGDITNLVTDVIVSSDDTYLQMNGGVSWRIREVGGYEIYQETRQLIPLDLGDVAVTTAGHLQAKKIFHGVVIDWPNQILPSANIIRQVVHNCLDKANHYCFKSIAFPLLGTGAGYFSVQLAWESTVLQIIKDISSKNHNVHEVVIVLYKKRLIKELNIEGFLERIKKSGWRLLVMQRRGGMFE